MDELEQASQHRTRHMFLMTRLDQMHAGVAWRSKMHCSGAGRPSAPPEK